MGFQCLFTGTILPLFESEKDWPNPLRLILYLMGLGYTFLGVAVISDVFMTGIEKITSSKKRVLNKATGRLITVYVWNATVANLTLMALGSSAPEILLSLIEITIGKFQLGPLGAGTIVGSAAFNLLCISAVCVCAIPDGEVRYVKEVPVYVVTSTCSVFAYLWLMFILMASSPDVCEIWEGVITLLFCPFLVIAAYLADRGYFNRRSSAYEEQEDSHNSAQTLSDDVSVEELAAIEHEIREQHGANLTSEQVVKIMQATYFQKRSRAYYRHVGLKNGAAVFGRGKSTICFDGAPDRSIQEAFDTVDDVEADKALAEVTVGFASERYCVLESCGHVVVTVLRTGDTDVKLTVKYTTRDGTATCKDDYGVTEGTLTFEKGEVEQQVKISIKDDVAYEDDEEFYIDLSDPQCEGTEKVKAVIGLETATVVIIDDDQPGMLRFKTEEMEVQDEVTQQVLWITVERFNGATGTISCRYNTDSMGAVDGIDFEGVKGLLEFPQNVQTANIHVTIKARGRLDNTSFLVVLTDPKNCKFDEKTDGGEEKCICNVKIVGKKSETRQALLQEMRDRAISANAIMGSRNWVNQFKDALFQVGDNDDEDDEDTDEKEGETEGPSPMDYVMHIVSIPWKLLFAFVPPPDYCGGWACFSGSLLMIAVVTAIVSDMANLVGCCFDILPETAAITFVALGTSLPDTFASKAAAMMDPYADASIGNITGSNSINVFMGIGLAWTIAAFRWELGERNAAWDETLSYLSPGQRENVLGMTGNSPTAAVFITPAGTIWFNLMVFSVNAFFAIQHLLQRRRRFGGELGGPKKGFFGQYFSAFFLVGQWFLYVTASIIFARTQDGALTYGQIAIQEAAAA